MVLATSNLARSIGNRLKKTLKTKLSHNMQPKKKVVWARSLSRWIGKNGQKWAKMSKNEQK